MNAIRKSMKLPVFMALILIIVLGITTFVFADGLSGDADADALTSPHGNNFPATQPSGTTKPYSLSALITQSNKNNVFPSSIVVGITSSGDWTNSVPNPSFTFNGYDTPEAGTVNITVPCDQEGTSKTITVLLDASNVVSNGKKLSPDQVSLTYEITAGPNDASCTPADKTAPVVTVPSDMTAEATSFAGAVVTFETSALDGVDGAVDVTCNPASGSTFPLGTTTVNCSATDAHNNTANGSFTVTVQDTTAPALNLPANITKEADGPTGSVVSFTASATDVVDGAVAVTCTPASGLTFTIGETTVICSATDAHKNAASGSFKVTVKDTTPPTLGLPADITAEATGPNGAAVTFADPTANDIVDGSVAVSCDKTSGSTFALGTTTVSCSATDAHNNTATSSFKVIVVDTTPPALSLPTKVTEEATGPSGAVVNFTATADDLVDGSVLPVCSLVSGSTFAIGDTTVNCSATDAHGNGANGTFTVTVQDTTPPTMTLPANITAEATGPSGAAVTFTATANDLVDGSVVVTCSPASGSTFALGTTTVNCSATDAHNNTATGSFTVTVQDTTAPVITINGIANGGIYTLGAVPAASCSAVDIVSGIVPCTLTVTGGTNNGVGTFYFTATAQDAAKNTATVTGKYQVIYRWDGFLQPINDTAHQSNQLLSIFKGGSTVPVKFQLKDASGKVVQSTTAPIWLTPVTTSQMTAAVDESLYSDPASSGNTYRWDATSQQYIYNWSTKGAATGFFWRIGVQFDDGQTYFVYIGLK